MRQFWMRIVVENREQEMDALEEWFLPKLGSYEAARVASKLGSYGVLAFAAMNILGVVLAVYFNQSPVDKSVLDAEAVQEHILGALILPPLILIIAYRVYVGKGWFVAGLVLVWFLAEISLKILGGTTNVLSIMSYVVIASMMINGIRGCWWIRGAGSVPETTEPDDQTDL